MVLVRTFEINDLADNELRTAIAAVRKYPELLGRKDCRRYLTRAEKAADEAQAAMRWRVPKSEHWEKVCDFLQERNEQLRQYIQTMYFTHKQVIDVYRESCSDAKARCMVAYILLEAATEFPRHAVSKIGTFVRNTMGVDRLFMGISYRGVFELWSRLTDIVCTSDVEGRVIDLTQDKNVVMSRDVFLNKITDDDMYNEALKIMKNGEEKE